MLILQNNNNNNYKHNQVRKYLYARTINLIVNFGCDMPKNVSVVQFT
jgi:hypothetical protein